MKILVITTKSPYPLNEGRALRTYNLINEMSRKHELHLISFVQDQLDIDGIEHMRTICPVVRSVPLYVGTTGKLKLISDVLKEPFSKLPVQVLKYFHQGMLRTIHDLMSKYDYDLVHLDMLHLAVYLPYLGKVPALLMEHNVEAQILRRRADVETHPLKRAYLRRQESKLLRFEAASCRNASVVVSVSDVDAEHLNELASRQDVICVPNGVDVEYFRRPEHPTALATASHTLVYVGGFTWFPNLDAIDHFRRDILPLISRSVPDVKLRVIGRFHLNAQVREIQKDPRVELCGLVDDIRPTVLNSDVYIVPLRIGGGTRLKILDALSMSKAIVSTSIGCEGLDVSDGKDIVVADGPEAFAAAIIDLFEHPETRQRLGEQGRLLAESTYSWSAIASRLDHAYARAAQSHSDRVN